MVAEPQRSYQAKPNVDFDLDGPIKLQFISRRQLLQYGEIYFIHTTQTRLKPRNGRTPNGFILLSKTKECFQTFGTVVVVLHYTVPIYVS